MAGLLGDVGNLLGLTAPLPLVGTLLGGGERNNVQQPTDLPINLPAPAPTEAAAATTAASPAASPSPDTPAPAPAPTEAAPGVLTTLTPLVTTADGPTTTAEPPPPAQAITASSLLESPAPEATSSILVPEGTPTIVEMFPPSSTELLPSSTLPPPPADSNTVETEPSSQPSNLVPALSITLGLAAVWIILGFLLVRAYRKSKWPFNGRRFAKLDDEETERREQAQQAKWDPARSMAPSDRLSRFFAQRQQTPIEKE